MIRRLLTVVTVLGVALVAATSASGTNDKVTLCHAAGLAGTTQYVTITVGYPAAYGPGGHFNEDGTTQAGHEQDYLGACNEEPPPNPCPDGDFNGEEEGCGTPPVNPCPNGDLNGEAEGCEDVVIPPVEPPTPPAPCPDGGEHNAGKDGQVPGSGNTNDDCDRSVTPPVVVTPPVTPETPVAPVTPTPPVVTPETPEAPVTKPEKPKKEKEEKVVEKTEPKPDAPVATTEAKPATAKAKETLPFTGVPAGLYALIGIVLTGAGALMRRFN